MARALGTCTADTWMFFPMLQRIIIELSKSSGGFIKAMFECTPPYIHACFEDNFLYTCSSP